MTAMTYEQEVARLRAEMKEIVESARATQGDPFGQAVAVLFEIMEVVTVGGMMAGCLEQEIAAKLRPGFSAITASLMGWVKVLTGLNDEKFAEALALARSMSDRQFAAQMRVAGAA